MTDFSKQIGLRGGGRTEDTRDWVQQPGRPDQFVLDMESVSLLSHTNTTGNTNDNSQVGELGSTDSQVALALRLQKNLSRKGSTSVEGEPANNNHNHHLRISRGAGLQPPIHHNPGHSRKPLIVVDSPVSNGSAGTPEVTTSLRRKRAPSSPSTWLSLSPSRVLLIFATISSVGTLILLYYTLSQGRRTVEIAFRSDRSR